MATALDVTIRQEKAADIEEVDRLVAAAFAPIQEEAPSEPLLVHRLRESESFVPELSLVAERNGQIIGHILLTRIEIESNHQSAEALALAPVSVLPSFQRRGVGGSLIRESHQIAKDMGFPAVVLLGHKDYYPRFGYRKASDFGITLPFDVPEEFCMAIPLWDGALDSISGRVVYPEAFFGKA